MGEIIRNAGTVGYWDHIEAGNLKGLEAALKENPELIKLKSDSRLDTGLHVAARQNNPDMIALLARYELPVDARNKSDNTPLMVAAFEGNAEAVTALLDAGADPNALRSGENAVFWALKGKNDDGVRHTERFDTIMTQLAARGANLSHKNGSGETAADFAEYLDDAKSVKLLQSLASAPPAQAPRMAFAASAPKPA